MIESKKTGEVMAEAKIKKEAKPIKVNVNLKELREFKKIITNFVGFSVAQRDLVCGLTDIADKLLTEVLALGKEGEKIDAWLQKKQKNLSVFVAEANFEDYNKLAKEIREKFLELTRISAKIDGLNTSLNLVVDLINKHIDECKIDIKDF
jgi:hypothetical protein